MKSGRTKKFKLEKLYLDCIDDSGNCFIIYWAQFEFWFIRVIYSGLIFSDTDGTTIEKSSLKRIPGPPLNELLYFNNHLLQIRGSWNGTDDPLSLVLLKDGMNNELTWDCHHPKALVEIVFQEQTFKGFGYAETLFLNRKPWNLPIEELRWGRFLSADYTITWIQWKGNYPVNKIFCNGKEYSDSIIEEDRIVFGKGLFHLLFSELSIIRSGKLSNLFSMMPWMKVIFNNRILNTLEIKYKTKSTLNQNSKTLANGWSLFEIVIFGK